MSVRLRLAAFVVALAATFTATFAAGHAFGPDDVGRPPPATADPPAGEQRPDEGPDDMTDDTTVEHAPGHGSGGRGS